MIATSAGGVNALRYDRAPDVPSSPAETARIELDRKRVSLDCCR